MAPLIILKEAKMGLEANWMYMVMGVMCAYAVVTLIGVSVRRSRKPDD